MKHLGDITKINGAEIDPVDYITGGSPCQDLSVAGKRAGLDGERSGLFMEQIRIIKEMREHDKQSGRTGQFIRPRYMVWENVPGAFSSNKAEDFRIVLEETAKVAEADVSIPRPPKKWANAGCIMGNGWSIAWRVLDAQFWGVPQRRRRIALVADFGGESAPEILFIEQGVSWHPAESGAERQGAAANTERGIGAAISCLNDQGGSMISADDDATISPTLRAEMHGNIPAVCAGFKLGQGAAANGLGYQDEMAPTLSAMDSGNKPAVLDMTHACDVIRECGDIVPSLQARMGTGGNQIPLVMDAIAIDRASFNMGENAKYGMGIDESGVTFSLTARGPSAVATMQAIGEYKMSETASSLKQRDYKDATDLAVNGYSVRRLTPLECERLQGYPDGWTDIGEYTDSKGKRKQSSDSARYKALGNSIALPPWRHVLGGIHRHGARTMGSLFDGIGGFPLICKELGGEPLWASEIEEFPIAVTKMRFRKEQHNETIKRGNKKGPQIFALPQHTPTRTRTESGF